MYMSTKHPQPHGLHQNFHCQWCGDVNPHCPWCDDPSVEESFKRVDLDGSGELEYAEFKQMLWEDQ